MPKGPNSSTSTSPPNQSGSGGGAPIEKKRQFHDDRYGEPASYPPADHVRISMILELIGRPHRVLDIGCRDGYISSLIMKQGNRVTGLDVSRGAVTLAKERGIDAREGDIENGLFFDNESFDVVLMGEVIEHLFSVDRALTEVHRVLRPSGYLVVSTPNLASLGRRLLLLFGRNPLIEVSFAGNAAGHVRYFVKPTLLNLLKSHNFKVDSVISDVVNFDNSGNLFSSKLARIAPGLGKSIIVRAIRGSA